MIDANNPSILRAMHRQPAQQQPCGRCPACRQSRPRQCVRFAQSCLPDPELTPNPECACSACNPGAWWMIVCALCGNKRCPHAEDHRFACTNSNDSGQVGKIGPSVAPTMAKFANRSPASAFSASGEPSSGGTVILDVFLPCIPPAGTAQQKGVSVRNGKPFFFTKAKMKHSESQWTAIFKPLFFEFQAEGPLALTLEFVYPWLKGEKKAVKEKYFRIPKATAGDADNLSKIPVDLLTKKGAWGNDAQLAILNLSKWHGREPGVRIKIETVNPVL
jgi:Holliday junction resolvase RusA-like endonuclease